MNATNPRYAYRRGRALRRNLLLTLVACALLAGPSAADAQIPGLPGLGEGEGTGLRVQLASGDPRDRVRHEKQSLLERQQALIAVTPDLETWQRLRVRYTERLAEVSAEIERVTAAMQAEQDAETRWEEESRAYKAALARWKLARAEARERARKRAKAAAEARAKAAAAAKAAAEEDGTGLDGDDPMAPAEPGEPGEPGEPTAPAEPDNDERNTAPEGDAPAAADAAGDAAGQAIDEEKLFADELAEAGVGSAPNAKEPGPRPGRTHPAYPEELERLRALLDLTNAELGRLVAGVSEERELLTRGLERADLLLAEYDEAGRDEAGRDGETDDAAGPKPVSLKRARDLSYDLYLAGLEVSLVRSQLRGLEQAADEDEEGSAASNVLGERQDAELPEDASETTRETYRLSRKLLEESEQLAAQIARLAERRRARARDILDTRRRVARLEVAEREQRERSLEAELDDAMRRIQITAADLADQKRRFDSLSPKISADITRVQAALDERRLLAEREGREGETTPSHALRLRELEVYALQEELGYHELRRERMQFVHQSHTALHELLSGNEADERFLDRFARVLEPKALEERKEEIKRRHEAWRRQHLRLSRSKPKDPAEEVRRRETMGALQRLVELCAKQEYTLESEARLASIVNFHLERYREAARSAWWYILRYFLSGLFVLFALAASVFLGRIMIRISRLITARARRLSRAVASDSDVIQEASASSARTAVFVAYFTGLLLIWLGAAYLAVQLAWGVELGLDRVGEVLDKTIIWVGETEITGTAIIKLLVTILVSIFVSRLVQAFLHRQVFQFFEWDEGVRHAVSSVLRYIVILVGVSIGLEYVGLGFGTFAVLLGVIGLGIGFGLQSIANNFISGFIILFERPVKKGDFVVADDLEGRVQTVSARATTIQTRDNVSVIIPNSELVSGRVVNWSHEDPRIRLRIPVGVAYGSDLAVVEGVLLEVGGCHHEILDEPAPDVHFRGFGDSALDFELLVWTKNIEGRFGIASDLNKSIDARFREVGIEIPFPQRDVHIRSKV